MAYTLLGAVYVPTHFTQEIIQLTATLSELWQSGIIGSDPQLAGKARQGGRIVEMPFWHDLVAASQPINSGTTLNVNSVTGDQDQAVVWERGTGFGAETLTSILGQSDPLGVIQQRIAAWWTRELQTIFISILKGVFAAPSMADLLYVAHHTTGGAGSYTDANTLNAGTAILAAQMLGDAKENLTAWCMHSAVEASLALQDRIEETEDSNTKQRIKTFQGKRVIVDDGCPVEEIDGDDVYTSFLFAPGAFGYEEDSSPRNILGGHGSWNYEESRTANQDLSALFTRKRALIHCRGVAFQNANADTSPTNVQFEDPDNWELVYEKKKMRVAAMTHNINLEV